MNNSPTQCSSSESGEQPGTFVLTTPEQTQQIAPLWSYSRGFRHEHKEFVTELTRFNNIKHLVPKDVVVLSCNPGSSDQTSDIKSLEMEVEYWEHPHPPRIIT